MSKDKVNPKARATSERVIAELKTTGALPTDPKAATALRERVAMIVEHGSLKPLADDSALVRRLRSIGCGVRVDAVEDLGFGYTPHTRRAFTLTPDGILFNSESPKRTARELEVADDIRRVLAAIAQKPVMRFVYTDADGQTRTHNVVPVRLYEGTIPNADGHRWLLEGFDVDLGDLRAFDVRTILFGTMSEGVEAIRVERAQQLTREGWDSAHDDAYFEDELVRAAACYALHDSRASAKIGAKDAWPWNPEWDKREKHPKLRRLAIAGALIAAAFDAEARRVARAGGAS